MTGQHILDEISRTAKTSGGVPLGRDRFEQETGIRYTEWFGRHWSRERCGSGSRVFPRIFFQDAYDDDEVIEKLIGLVRELGHVPVTGELRIVSNGDAEPTPDEKPSTEVVGFIYLMKHGRPYKIRKTDALNTN
jgi:hypothetical protein